MSEFQTREYARSLDDLRHGASLGLGERKEMAQSVSYFVAALLTRFEKYDESMDLIAQMVTAGQSEALFVVPAGLAALRVPMLPAEVPASTAPEPPVEAPDAAPANSQPDEPDEPPAPLVQMSLF